MVSKSGILALRGFKKKQLTELARQAKRFGMSREEYARTVLEEKLDIERDARSRTFAEISGGGQEVDEAELDQLVESIRKKNYQRSRRK